MKIPFDISKRPQIESGEYKVETRDGKPARIICWDKKEYKDQREQPTPIVYLITSKGGCEHIMSCTTAGMYSDGLERDSDLFIITPEPEPLTKLEKAVFDMLVERTNEATISEKQARKYAPVFLEIVKDEIYSNESLVEYAKKAKAEGKAEALKDLPRWKIADRDFISNTVEFAVSYTHEGGDYARDWVEVIVTNVLHKGESYFEISDLEKLPKDE